MALPCLCDGVNWSGLLAVNLRYELPYDRCGSIPRKLFSNAIACNEARPEDFDVVHPAACVPRPFLIRRVDQARFEIGANDGRVSVNSRTINRFHGYAHRGVWFELLR